jgi:2'-5' RNA ligase
VTLAFLGPRPSGDLPVIVEALRGPVQETTVGPLEVRRWRVTRSVGMLVLADPTGGATRLRAALRAGLTQAGIDVAGPEPWLPHVTVVRHRGTAGPCGALPVGRTLVPSDATAYLSRLSPTGARYTALARLPLHRTTEEDRER